MKKMSVTFSINETSISSLQLLEQSLQKVMADGYDYIIIEFCFITSSGKKDITKFVKCAKKIVESYSDENNVLIEVNMILSASQIDYRIAKVCRKWLSKLIIKNNLGSRIKNKINVLIKNKINYYVLFEKVRLIELRKEYLFYRKWNIPIFVDSNYNDFSQEIIDFYKVWATDANGIDISLFSDLANSILCDSKMEICRYSSCLTHHLFIDENGNLSYCRFIPDKSFLGKITDNAKLSDFFSQNLFMNILSGEIERREGCKNSCELFLKCQGACPLVQRERDVCTEADYKAVYINIYGVIKAILKSDDYSDINPYLRVSILGAFSKGYIFI